MSPALMTILAQCLSPGYTATETLTHNKGRDAAYISVTHIRGSGACMLLSTWRAMALRLRQIANTVCSNVPSYLRSLGLYSRGSARGRSRFGVRFRPRTFVVQPWSSHAWQRWSGHRHLLHLHDHEAKRE